MKLTMVKLFTALIFLSLLLAPATPVFAQEPDPDGEGRIIFGSNFTVESGDTFNGDLVVFGGNVTIEEDAVLNGDLVVIGGTIRSNGEMQGDIVVMGGQVSLEEAALVEGDVITIGGQLDQAEGARIEGEVVNNAAPDILFPTGRIPPDAPGVPDVEVPVIPRPEVVVNYNPFGEFVRVLGSAVLVSFLGVLATLFFQSHLARVSQAVVIQPLMTTSIGLLTIVVLLIAALTLILLPLVGLSLIPLAFAWLFGVIAIGQEIGERLARALRQEWQPVIATAIGTFVLVFIVASVQSLNHLLPFMACVTWILPALVGLLAVGAVVMTRFGTRPVQVPALTVSSPPPPPSEPRELPPAA
ncbi:MAG TPA: polymer-forming cytoskeletal protein [Anaerolineales bacterium]|nr:polymer-forming cytoskeletal protein [Anaerolineales bacterium]